MKSRFFRLFSIIAMLGMMGGMLVTDASAEPPGNDTREGAIAIDSVPYYSDQVDLSEAGNDDLCWEGPGVWYMYTPDSDVFVRAFATVYQSDPFTAVLDAGMSELSCQNNWEGVDTIFLAGGSTYYFVVGSGDQYDTVSLTLEIGNPPLEVTGTLNRTGTVDRIRGTATISGTVTCSADAGFNVGVTLSQRASRTMIVVGNGGEDTGGTCPAGQSVSWTVTVISRDYGSEIVTPFKTGKAYAEVTIFAYYLEGEGNASANLEGTVQLQSR